ncbi:helix-turn-helix transcriptional regulator [Microtetraspora malaysiensis]|uniref:helix-turn-helix transcriptional regulator n=1 Tax=Microtetraspora malaysiensis TaxID=161358 RepID=UPI00082B6401|nr:helix-turn-helix transcriptional regulator [Microtetraspora malaysiensis]
MHDARMWPDVLWRWRSLVPVLFIAGLGLCSVAILAFARASGTGGYATHPISTLALAGGATGIALLSRRLADRGDRTGGDWLLALATAVLIYLVLGALAVVAVTADSGMAPLLLGAWGGWWPVPLAVLQLAALRAEPRARQWSIGFGVVVAGAAVCMALALEPVKPFAGHPPAAPEGWRTPAVTAASTILVSVVMLAAVLFLASRAARVPADERASATLGAAAAAVGPLLIVVCMGTAVASGPGDIAPTDGSVAYLVSLAAGCLVGAWALIVSANRARPSAVRRLLHGVLGGYAVIGVTLAVTWTGAVLRPAGPLISGLAVAAVTAVIGVAWWRASSALTGFAVPLVPEPAEPPAPSVVPPAPPRPGTELPPGLEVLSPREREVLALVATGARDAAIAEHLHLSRRTVETHLRRIFTKLGLESDDGRNRRLLAARVWLEAMGTDAATDRGPVSAMHRPAGARSTRHENVPIRRTAG